MSQLMPFSEIFSSNSVESLKNGLEIVPSLYKLRSELIRENELFLILFLSSIIPFIVGLIKREMRRKKYKKSWQF